MIDADERSYLPYIERMRFTADDQPPPDNRTVWMRVHHVPLTFPKDRETGRRWVWVYGRLLALDGTPLDEIQVRVWLSVLPLHEPEATDPVLCARCDQPTKWPCPPAKARMLADYEGNRARLGHYLARHLCAANWHDPLETPRDTYNRIVGWTWDEDARAALGN